MADKEPSEIKPGRVIGIGGVFFKSTDSERLNTWYADNLGMPAGAGGFDFKWRDHDRPEVERHTVLSVFPQNSTYFDPSPAPLMLNYIVDDLDAILAKLAKNGARIDPKREDHDYGRFAWIYDPDGNKIELWEPR
ncbi:MAG TPA: VOC family protein [Bryobacteraceae bacterium]|nr:VOC family protein [Bryobacteraceae bacterium]